MAHFELWERATLNEFAREATRKLLENDAEIKRLRALLDQPAENARTRLECAKHGCVFEADDGSNYCKAHKPNY